MTTQFAIDYLLDDCQDCPENKDGECMTQSHCFEVKQLAIKALEQEPKTDILVKIRDEIAAIYPDDYPCNMRIPERIRDMAVEIVEKYMEGSNE